MSDDDEFTTEELETLANGIEALGTIDAHMRILQATLLAHGTSERELIVGLHSQLFHDAADLMLAWQAFADTPFGALFDPSIIPPENPPEEGSE